MTKKLKLADLVLQVLITLFFVGKLFSDPGFMSNLGWYFFLGGWQVMSCLAHLAVPVGWIPVSGRKQYGACLFWIIVIFLLLLLLAFLEVPLIIFLLFALLFVGPVMAIWYWLICWEEYVQLRHRSLIHLK